MSFVEADFLTWEGAPGYDFVSFVATLHHLPFPQALERAAALLRPGGVLAILGLSRARSWLEAVARSSIAFPVSLGFRLTRARASVGAPLLEPSMTLDEIRRHAPSILPTAVIRRHLLWRYSLLWTRPPGSWKTPVPS